MTNYPSARHPGFAPRRFVLLPANPPKSGGGTGSASTWALARTARTNSRRDVDAKFACRSALTFRPRPLEALRKFLIAFALLLLVPAAGLRATNSYSYQPGEYVTISNGVSPDGRYAIAASGNEDDFHIYLMNAKSGRKIGPLTEMKEFLDTGASAFNAEWSANSGRVTITWRRSRHNGGMTITYRIANGRAYHIGGSGGR